METKKKFDCLEMKSTIQQKIYAETKGMSTKELLLYFNDNKKSGKTDIDIKKSVARRATSRAAFVCCAPEQRAMSK